MSEHIQKIGDIEAIRYGGRDGQWEEDAPTRVAAFVLGFDVSERTTALNERAYDVVKPIKQFWRPAEGVADIEVFERAKSRSFVLSLGNWIGRYSDGTLRAFPHDSIQSGTFPVSLLPPVKKTFEQRLLMLLKDYRSTTDLDMPNEAMARYLTLTKGLLDQSIGGQANWRRDG